MKKLFLIISIMLFLQKGISYSQTLQVTLSPDKSKVDRSTSSGTATIFFNSSIEDLSILCTDENPNEPIVKVGDNLWFTHIDVKKDIETDGVCYRNYLLKSSLSSEYSLTTPEIRPNEVLYYTVVHPNYLEPTVLKGIVSTSENLVDEGDSYLARRLLLEALPANLERPNRPYIPEAEAVFRKALKYDNCIFRRKRKDIGHMMSAMFNVDGTKVISVFGRIHHTNFPNSAYIEFWDEQTGKFLNAIDFDEDKITSFRICTDNKTIVISTTEKIHIINSANGNIIKTLDEVGGADLVLLSNDDKKFITINDNYNCSYIDIWNTRSWKCEKTIEFDKNITSADLSTDGKNLVIASSIRTDDGELTELHLLDIRRGVITRAIKGHKATINSVVFSPDGNRIASASDDHTIIVWDTVSGDSLFTIEGHQDAVCSVEFSPHGEKIISTSKDKTINIWDTEEGLCQGSYHINKDNSDTFHASFHPEGKEVLLLSDETVRIIDLKEFKTDYEEEEDEYGQIDYGPNEITLSSFLFNISPNANYLATMSDEKNNIVVWDIASQKKIKSIRVSNNCEEGYIDFSEDEQSVAYKCYDDNYIEIDVEKICAIYDSPDGNERIEYHPNDFIYFYDIKKNICLDSIKIDHELRYFQIRNLEPSKDGSKILIVFNTGYGSETVQIVDKKTGTLIEEQNTHQTDYTIFSQDGRRIIRKYIAYFRICEFLPLQEIIDKTRKRFEKRAFTDEEKKKYHLVTTSM